MGAYYILYPVSNPAIRVNGHFDDATSLHISGRGTISD